MREFVLLGVLGVADLTTVFRMLLIDGMGHEDFVMAAAAAYDGHSLVCLPSTARVGGERISRLVSHVAAWTPITTPRHHVDVVIREVSYDLAC